MQEAFTAGLGEMEDSRARGLALVLPPRSAQSIPFVHRAKANEARRLTVSPVPKTITSYSSSMLYHRLSRLALFLPWEMKGIEGKNGSESTKTGFFLLPFALPGCFQRLVQSWLLFINH